MNIEEFRAVCLELIKQYKALEPPIKDGINALLVGIDTSTEDDIEAIICTIFSAFYDKKSQ